MFPVFPSVHPSIIPLFQFSLPFFFFYGASFASRPPSAFPLIGKAYFFAEFTEIYIRFMRVVKSFH
jgi:hypothetical protein